MLNLIRTLLSSTPSLPLPSKEVAAGFVAGIPAPMHLRVYVVRTYTSKVVRYCPARKGEKKVYPCYDIKEQ